MSLTGSESDAKSHVGHMHIQGIIDDQSVGQKSCTIISLKRRTDEEKDGDFLETILQNKVSKKV